jgi:putative membrane protein
MKYILLILVLLLSISLVSAHNHNLDEAKQLIGSEIACDKLSDEQLEMIGEYYMEQMHPDEAHEIMDQMMGGESSNRLKQMHIQMARRLYCNENVGGMIGGSMMNMMMGSGGMMNMVGGSAWSGSWWLWIIVGTLFWIALLVALILLIIWIYKKITGQAINDSSALEILKKRFVKGEITKKQFESMKKEIK